MNNTQYDQDIIDHIREYGYITLDDVIFFTDHTGHIRWDNMPQVKVILTRLVSEERLITSTNGLVFRLPHGDHKADYRFTPREAKRVGGTSVWGIVWDFGGESWSWSAYGLALDYARDYVSSGEVSNFSLGVGA